MIASLEGKLIRLETDRAIVQVGQVGYEVLLAGYCINSLSSKTGLQVELCTMQYLEGSPGGGNLLPRMVGFLNTSERDFFAKFTSVKGIGIRKGLRALALPVATVAAAIESGDTRLLTSLPEIGKRTAEHIVAELKGKLAGFASGGGPPDQAAGMRPFQREALEILIAWGEKRNEAAELVELACRKYPDINSAEALVPLVYRLKQGVEV